MCVCVHVCMCACVCVCMRACVCACVRVCGNNNETRDRYSQVTAQVRWKWSNDSVNYFVIHLVNTLTVLLFILILFNIRSEFYYSWLYTRLFVPLLNEQIPTLRVFCSFEIMPGGIFWITCCSLMRI